MKRWLLLSLVPIGLLLLAAGALLLRPAGQAEAEIAPGDALSCSASGGSGDALVVAPDSPETSLTTSDTAALSAQCYYAGLSRLVDGCGCSDLYVLRYLCYRPQTGWYYRNYLYCVEAEEAGDLDPDGGGTGLYSYKGGSNCPAGSADWVDPITVVFYGGIYTDVQEHACDHGSWCFNSGGAQRFWTYGCYDQDGNANSANPNLTQYHMRIKTALNWYGNYACDPNWGRYNLATPHHEYWTMWQPGCGNAWHSVDDNDLEAPGGFVRARRDIMKNWVENGPHKYGGSQFWDNTEHKRQSAGKGLLGGCWYAWSDGWVDFISLEHE
jgi:hypothetical protein